MLWDGEGEKVKKRALVGSLLSARPWSSLNSPGRCTSFTFYRRASRARPQESSHRMCRCKAAEDTDLSASCHTGSRVAGVVGRLPSSDSEDDTANSGSLLCRGFGEAQLLILTLSTSIPVVRVCVLPPGPSFPDFPLLLVSLLCYTL